MTSSSASASTTGAFTSPYAIQITAPEDWFSDFSARETLIQQNSSPAPENWYSTTYPSTSYSWGPTNPQLYSVSSTQIGHPGSVQALREDRGSPVYNATFNTPPAGVSTWTWNCQRLMWAAQQFIGTPYQHLHLPQFNPALVSGKGSFRWNPVSNLSLLQSSQQLLAGVAGNQSNPYAQAYGVPGLGIDCTDFTAYIYNWALGIQMYSSTGNQVQFPEASGSGIGGAASATILDSRGNLMHPKFFYSPNYATSQYNQAGDLTAVIDQLQPGDLLYIGSAKHIVHVVLWLGSLGTMADGSTPAAPLVISSHDNTPAIFALAESDQLDLTSSSPLDGFPADGQIAAHLPPPGVQILPFTALNWFYQDFQLAMRVLPDEVTEAAT